MKFEELVQKAKKISLEPQEKAVVRHWLEHLTRPVVSSSILVRHLWQRSVLNKIKPMPIFASLIIMSMLGGGVSFAAENSLPGDFLYPVKVNVNEEVRAFLTVGTEAKANWDASRLERRLEEVGKLAAKGELTEKRQAAAEESFQKQEEKTRTRVIELETKEKFARAAEISNRLETSIAVRGKILKRISATAKVDASVSASVEAGKSEGKAEVKPITISVEQSQNAAAEIRITAENKIAEVEKFLLNLKERTSAETFVAAQARLEIARSVFAEGDVKLKAGSSQEAFELFRKAHRVAQDAKLVLEAEQDFQIQIQFNGNQESAPIKVGATIRNIIKIND